MSEPLQPLRCPGCHALVVDRRSPVCTSCRQPLPAEWIMTKAQAAKMKKLDAQARALHTEEMHRIDPRTNPDIPPLVRLLDAPLDGSY